MDTNTTDAEARRELNEKFNINKINTSMFDLNLLKLKELKTLIAEYCIYLAFGPEPIAKSPNLQSIHQFEMKNQQRSFGRTYNLIRAAMYRKLRKYGNIHSHFTFSDDSYNLILYI